MTKGKMMERGHDISAALGLAFRVIDGILLPLSTDSDAARKR